MSRAPTLQKALYDALVSNGRPMPVAALSDATGRAPSVVRTTLRALQTKGVVATVPAGAEEGFDYVIVVIAPYEGNWADLEPEAVEKIRANVALGARRWREAARELTDKLRRGERALEQIDSHLASVRGAEA